MTSSEIKIVPKGWGYEKWIANSELYCGKLLFIRKGHRCSWHYHTKKDCYLKINEIESKLLKGYKNLIVTKGSGGADYNKVNYPGEKTKIVDVVGAGDTFLSALVYFYLLCGTIEKAIPYANKASAIAVQNFGTYVLTEKDVKDLCD